MLYLIIWLFLCTEKLLVRILVCCLWLALAAIIGLAILYVVRQPGILARCVLLIYTTHVFSILIPHLYNVLLSA